MIGEGDIPILIAKKCVKLAHCRLLLVVAPRKPTVLEMNFFKITIVEGRSEAANPTTVHIARVFVASFIDLIKVARDQPFGAPRRFLAAKRSDQTGAGSSTPNETAGSNGGMRASRWGIQEMGRRNPLFDLVLFPSYLLPPTSQTLTL